jgi:hypothetical protein
MNRLVEIAGNIAALLGILVCVAAGAARVLGNWYVGSVQIHPLFTVGVALMVFGCLAKLHLLSSK